MTANRSSGPDLFSLLGRERPASPSPTSSSAEIDRESGGAQSSRHVLPQNLDSAIRQLNDRELERLLLTALEERVRRKLPIPEETEGKRQAKDTAVPLPQGKLKAIRAAFKAGVTPSRIARQFGVSRRDRGNAPSHQGNVR